ncbi:MAG TPA: adenylate/guanylate cyclase domain-containing protein [Gaiellaceae bacterium]|nr:adenylate/guanylate cyclase domain-containing protein [Gaiellaceae bacterium]
MRTPGEASSTESAAVLNGDVAGYSKLVADDEIATHRTLQAFRRIIEGAVTEEGGEVVEFVGDEFLAVLPTRPAGLGAAVAIQRALGAENEQLPAGRRMRFRLGLNYGPVSVEGGRWFGDVINVAARLQALAEPGGICASAAALEGTEDLPVRVRSLGRKRLKNIPEPVLAYEVVDDQAPTGDGKPWRRRIPTSERPSLAVSPFVNLGASEDDHFADGLMMALVIELMTIPGLDVISEFSSLAYRGQAPSAQQIGQELGVRFVLEGAVQRSGSRVRVMTKLLGVETSATVWADRFEAELSDVFAAQDDIVAKIVETLDLQIIGDLAHTYRDQLDSEGVEILYRGLHEAGKSTPDSLRRAYGYFQQLVERNPDSARGYSLSAWIQFWAALTGKAEDPDASYRRAEELARAAIDRDDRTGLGHLVLAHVLVLEHDWDGALEAALAATEERPACDVTFGVAASVMRYLGRWEEAVDMATRAIRLSPLLSEWYRAVLANAYFVGEDYEIAAETAEGVVAGDEDNVEALLTLAAAQAALGRARHASAAVKQAQETVPGLSASRLRDELPYRDDTTKERFVGRLEEAGLG